MADAEDGGPEKASQAPTATGQGGGAPPGQQGNPSVYGGMTRGPMNPSMAPTSAPPKRGGGGIINKPKFPELGANYFSDKQLVKQLLAEFLGTMLLVIFGIGSIIATANLGPPCNHITLWTGMQKCSDVQSQRQQPFIPGKFCPSTKLPTPPPPPPPNTKPPPPPPPPKEGCDAEKAYTWRIIDDNDFGANPLKIAFAFGIAVASIAQAIGHISGAHLNPAVSFGLVCAGECSVVKACVYTVVQTIGAIIGCGIVRLWTWRYIIESYGNEQAKYQVLDFKISPSYIDGVVEAKESFFKTKPKSKDDTPNYPEFNPNLHTYGWHLGTSLLGPHVDYFQGIFIEMGLTFILVLVVCGVCDSLRKDVKGSAPLAIGLTVFLCHVVGIHYTGSSVNPARSIGPVLYSHQPNKWAHLPVYIIGPLLGGVFAGFVYNIFFRAPSEETPPPQQQMTMPPTRPPSQTPSKMA